MSEETPRFKIPYPSDGQEPFYSPFESGNIASDSLHFSSFEQANTQVFGGGDILWRGATGDPLTENQLSFTEDIIFVSPTHGVLETWSASESPVTIPLGSFLVVSLTRGATAPVTLTKAGGDPTVIVTSSVPVSGRCSVLAYHAPNGSLYFPTSVTLSAGDTVSGIGTGASPTSTGEDTGTTTDATPTTISTITIDVSQNALICADIWGRKGDGDWVKVAIKASFDRNGVAIPIIMSGSLSSVVAYSSAGTLTTADANFVVVGNDVVVQVTGEAVTTIDWTVKFVVDRVPGVPITEFVEGTVSTTDATPTPGATVSIAVSTNKTINARVWGRKADGDWVLSVLESTYDRNVAAAPTLMTGSASATTSYSSAGTLTTAVAALVVSGNDVVVQVTGEAVTDIDWTIRWKDDFVSP